jgi:hypothetical protein
MSNETTGALPNDKFTEMVKRCADENHFLTNADLAEVLATCEAMFTAVSKGTERPDDEISFGNAMVLVYLLAGEMKIHRDQRGNLATSRNMTVLEVGDDESGTTRVILKCTREQAKEVAARLYKEVGVAWLP